MGVVPGTLVGLYTPRSLDLLVGALAIQKAGGGYVPLDPAYPPDRIALYIEDSGAPVIGGPELPGCITGAGAGAGGAGAGDGRM
jgi:acyl-CoA synthetase (AMP-forming)/AMP-acid ligase II